MFVNPRAISHSFELRKLENSGYHGFFHWDGHRRTQQFLKSVLGYLILVFTFNIIAVREKCLSQALYVPHVLYSLLSRKIPIYVNLLVTGVISPKYINILMAQGLLRVFNFHVGLSSSETCLPLLQFIVIEIQCRV